MVLHWTLAVPCAFTSLFSFYWNSSIYSGFAKLTQSTRLYQALWINGSRDQQAQPAHSPSMWEWALLPFEGRQTDRHPANVWKLLFTRGQEDLWLLVSLTGLCTSVWIWRVLISPNSYLFSALDTRKETEVSSQTFQELCC